MRYSKPKRETFESLRAASLFCQKCSQAVPVREKLLLVLPDGQLFEYLCKYCASSVGTRKEKVRQEIKILKPGTPSS
ncbi:MAG TPA: hypothetical protein VGB26_08860 [Nitrospiria bacterium]